MGHHREVGRGGGIQEGFQGFRGTKCTTGNHMRVHVYNISYLLLTILEPHEKIVGSAAGGGGEVY